MPGHLLPVHVKSHGQLPIELILRQAHIALVQLPGLPAMGAGGSVFLVDGLDEPHQIAAVRGLTGVLIPAGQGGQALDLHRLGLDGGDAADEGLGLLRVRMGRRSTLVSTGT